MARPIQDTLPEVQAIRARYLDGQEAFDAAAQDLAVILRQSGRRRVSSLVFLKSLSLGANRSPADRARALEVLNAAMRTLKDKNSA